MASGYALAATALALFGVGAGLVSSPSTESMIGSLPKAKAGVGSATNDTTIELGGALGAAVLGSILSSGYAAQVAGAARGLPAAAAGSGLGDALAAARQLGGPAGEGLAAAARAAFVHGLGTTDLAGLAVTLAGAPVTLAFLPARGAPAAHLHAARNDHGELPAVLGRADIESFLHHLAYLESAGQLSRDRRARICQDTGRVLSRIWIRALGLTAARQPAAGLTGSFMLTTGDVPQAAERPEPCRDLQAEVMRALTARLDDLERGSCGPEIRTGIELLIDTGRRPAEIATLVFDCLTRDADGSPVLIYDNHKNAREGRRLPVTEATANVIARQQRRVRRRFPNAGVGRLVLLPTVIGNPDGSRPVSVQSLIQRHHDWIGRMPPLILTDGREFDKAKIAPYCYRHTYVICTGFSA